ncbi:MAG: TonB-dependent receptor [Deltaproteobacteria bacterium]|nr:TonB-dependent receptor [Deltaproteobacteria bacterium]TLN03886.1 MAG: TonB-dependent receptor [bacterium]
MTNDFGPIRSFLAMLTRLLLLCLVFLVILQISVSHAESDGQPEPAPPDLTTLTIEQLMGIEVETVSGASRYEQPVSEAPASVSIVTADQIKKFGYRNLADILQSVPGFSVTNDRNYQYSGIRGFGLPGDYGTRVLLMVDGVRQNDPVYNSVFIGNELVVDTDLIERVEIIRGPGHTLYGANALMAVINIVTRRGGDLNGFEASGEAGSFDSYRGRMSYGSRFGDTTEMLLSGTFFHSQGQDLYYPEFASPASNFGWARDCDREQAGSAFLKMAYRDLTLEAGYVKRDKGLPTAPWGTVFNNPGTEATDSSLFVDLKYQHSFENGTDLMSRFSWNQYNYDGRYVYDQAEPPLLFDNIDKVRSSWLMGEIQVSKELLQQHRLIGGIEFRNALRLDQQNFDQQNFAEALYLDDRRSTWNAGFYLQDEYRILDSLILTAGIRYDYFESFGGTLNPRVALIYSPFSRTTVKFLFGTAFRPPNGYELYYSDGSTQKTNPDLHEESSTNYELILEQNLGKRFRGTLSGYYTRIRNLITLVEDPADDLLVFRNIGRAELRGVELELDKKWECGSNGRLSYSFQETRDLMAGERLPNSARHLVKLNLLLPLVEEKVFLGVEEQYTSRKKTLAGNQTGDFFITNVTLFGRNLLKNLELSGSVYNLFNSKYFVPAGGEHFQDSIEQDGRTFRVKATWRF